MVPPYLSIGRSFRWASGRSRTRCSRKSAALAGVRYAHDDGHTGIARWGRQPGSIFLADQKLPIAVPRVRGHAARREVPLATYQHLQTPRALNVGLFRRVLGDVGPVWRQV